MTTTTVILILDGERAKWNAYNEDVKSADERLRTLLLTNSVYKKTEAYEAELPEYYELFQKLNNGHNNRLRLLNQWIDDMEKDKCQIANIQETLQREGSGMDSGVRGQMQSDIQDLEKRVQDRRVLEQEARDYFAAEWKKRGNKHVELARRVSDFASNSSYNRIPQQMKEYCKNLCKWDEDVIKELNQLKQKRIEKPRPVNNLGRPAPVQPPPPPQNNYNQNYNSQPPPPPQNNNNNQRNDGIFIDGQDINPGCCVIL